MVTVRFLPYRAELPVVRSVAVTSLGQVAVEVRTDGAVVRLTLDAVRLPDDSPCCEQLIHNIIAALSDRRITTEFAVAPNVAGLRLDVLRAIAAIPQFSLASYSEIAQRVGRSDAIRYVASCVGRNPVPLLVPCHRVVPVSCGRNIKDALRRPSLLGNFTPDPRLKAYILRLEGYFDDENAPLVNFLS